MALREVKTLKPKPLAKKSSVKATAVPKQQKSVPAQWVAGVVILLAASFTVACS